MNASAEGSIRIWLLPRHLLEITKAVPTTCRQKDAARCARWEDLAAAQDLEALPRYTGN